MRTLKAWVAFAGAIVTGLSVSLADDVFDADDGVKFGGLLIGAAITLWGVYKARNAGTVNGSDPQE